MNKVRLDVYLVSNGMASGRERAKALIMAGQVYVDNQKCDKPGMNISEDACVEVRGNTLKYVSRGGLKLEKAMNEFPISLAGKVAMDIGASTGGFTDCMLQNGARRVYSVDVGYGQLAWSLRNDNRVINMERTNIRYVTEEDIGEKIDFASVDVSFISLKLVLPVVYNLLSDDGEAVALVKPQFEAGREQVGKKGVVRDINVHKNVAAAILAAAEKIGFYPCGFSFSPIKGPEGNIEYLMYLRKKENNDKIDEKSVLEVVESSHDVLNGE